MNTKSSRLKEELTCSVCYEMFANEPTRVPISLKCCQQVFCQSCVDQLQSCPNCRTEISRQDLQQCRIILNILDCLCSICHRCEMDKCCLDCQVKVCDGCVAEHLLVHRKDIKSKHEELWQILKISHSFVNTITEELSEFRVMLEQKMATLDEMKLPSRDDTKSSLQIPSIEDAYMKNLSDIRCLSLDIKNNVVEVLINLSHELNVPVPRELANFDRKPILESIESISNVDLAMPADAISFVNAVCVDQVLSQIIQQTSVDRRQLINRGTLQFQLLHDEIATCNTLYRKSVILATDKARVLMLSNSYSQIEFPSITAENHHPICGLAVYKKEDGNELILAVDGSNNVYAHNLNAVDEDWEVIFVGNDDHNFSDLDTLEETTFIASDKEIIMVTGLENMKIVSFPLNENEQQPKQIIILDKELVLLRPEHQKHLRLKKLNSTAVGKQIDFTFYVHHIQFNNARRILSVIAHHDASDQYALHTFHV